MLVCREICSFHRRIIWNRLLELDIWATTPKMDNLLLFIRSDKWYHTLLKALYFGMCQQFYYLKPRKKWKIRILPRIPVLRPAYTSFCLLTLIINNKYNYYQLYTCVWIISSKRNSKSNSKSNSNSNPTSNPNPTVPYSQLLGLNVEAERQRKSHQDSTFQQLLLLRKWSHFEGFHPQTRDRLFLKATLYSELNWTI